MSNERLRTALNRAGITTEQLAHNVSVDPKTVQKWLSGRVPHPRYRWAVAELVTEDEEFLWPDAHRAASNGSHNAEIVSSYARRADVDPSRWRHLIDQAHGQIDILGYTLFFLPQQLPELVDVLCAKCSEGCRLRMVMADPECEQVRLRDEEEQNPITLVARIQSSLKDYAPLIELDRAELRFQNAPLYNSVYRFDDEMFVTPHLFSTPGHAAPLLHLRRLGPNGLFSRFASHLEGIWSASRPLSEDRRAEPTDERGA